MRFLRLIKANGPGVALCFMMAVGLYVYFVVYNTSSRAYWYNDISKQIQLMYNEIRN